MKGVFRFFCVLGLVSLLCIQSNLTLNGLNFAQSSDDKQYEPSSDKFTVTIGSDGKYIDSGYRVSDTDGEVKIRRGDQPNAWENAWSGDVIYQGDVLFTEKDTECTISIPDQVTLHMQAQTEIFIDKNENGNNLEVIYGKVLVELEENYSQLPLVFELTKAKVKTEEGILIIENKESAARVLMLYGTAEITDLLKNETVLKSNEETTISDTGAEEIKQFSSDSELLEWTSEIRIKVEADLMRRQSAITSKSTVESEPTVEPKTIESSDEADYDGASIAKLFAVLIVVVGIVYIVLGRRKKN